MDSQFVAQSFPVRYHCVVATGSSHGEAAGNGQSDSDNRDQRLRWALVEKSGKVQSRRLRVESPALSKCRLLREQMIGTISISLRFH